MLEKLIAFGVEIVPVLKESEIVVDRPLFSPIKPPIAPTFPSVSLPALYEFVIVIDPLAKKPIKPPTKAEFPEALVTAPRLYEL